MSSDIKTYKLNAAKTDGPAVPDGREPTRDELWELWLRLNNELPDRQAAVAEFWEHAQIDARARAAKADGPAVPESREPAAVTRQPSDEELLDLLPQGNESGFWLPKGLPSDWVDGEFIAPPEAIIAFARDVLELWGNPTPQPPADGEVAELVAWLREQLHVCLQAPWTPGIKHFGRAAELLQRQVLVPVSISERLPGPEDCDAIGCCWWYSASHGWELYHREKGPGTSTHWLPAHALPLPEVGE